MGAYYDTIAEQYQKVHELPHSLHIDAYTYFHLLSELTGKSILDLACGEGFYSRQFKQKGAAKVVGVDISEKMIEIARHEEVRKPLDIQYIVHECTLELENKKNKRTFLLNSKVPKDHRGVNHVSDRSEIGVFLVLNGG